MSEWIRINNRLPKIGERVLVRRKNGDAHTSQLQFVDDEGQYYDLLGLF